MSFPSDRFKELEERLEKLETWKESHRSADYDNRIRRNNKLIEELFGMDKPTNESKNTASGRFCSYCGQRKKHCLCVFEDKPKDSNSFPSSRNHSTKEEKSPHPEMIYVRLDQWKGVHTDCEKAEKEIERLKSETTEGKHPLCDKCKVRDLMRMFEKIIEKALEHNRKGSTYDIRMEEILEGKS